MKQAQLLEPASFVQECDEIPLTAAALRELGRAILLRPAPLRFRASGSSMRPFIRDGDVITVQPLAQSKPCLGEVVAFVHPGTERLLVHRLVGRWGSAWLLRGDGSPWSDGWVPTSNLLGRVSRVERDGLRVRLGLGPERVLIAAWRRRNWLRPLRRLWKRRPDERHTGSGV